MSSRPSPAPSVPPSSSSDFDALFDAWMPTVLGWCRRLGGPKVDPEDAAHDVFVVVMRRRHSLRDEAAMNAWLFGITRRVLAQHRRRAWVRRWLPGAPLDSVRADAPDPGERSDAQRTRARVHEAVLALPDRYREVLVLCDLEERETAEVASILGVPFDTVKTRRRRGRQRLARALRDLAPEARS